MRKDDWFLREDEDEFGEALHRRTEELYTVGDAPQDEQGFIECPVIPLRDLVIFPRMVSPIFVGLLLLSKTASPLPCKLFKLSVMRLICH